MKNLKSFDEFIENKNVLDEKLDKNLDKYELEDVFITIELTGQADLEKDLYKPLKTNYIDTPGMFKDEYKDYNDVVDYLESNMGQKEFDKLYDIIEDAFDKNKNVLDNFMEKHAKQKVKLINKLN